MRKVSLFIAMSLDGYIADRKGGVGWLQGQGDAKLVQQLRNADLIDRYYITVIPTLLGDGLRLFEHGEHEILLRLVGSRSYNGMTDLIYEKR